MSRQAARTRTRGRAPVRPPAARARRASAPAPGGVATRARALTAPPLLAKRSTGPESRAAMSRERSSACSSTEFVVGAPSVRRLRSTPRGSYVTTVRSVKCPASVPKPAAPMGDPIRRRTVPSAATAPPDVVGQHRARDLERVGAVASVIVSVMVHLPSRGSCPARWTSRVSVDRGRLIPGAPVGSQV